MTKNWDCRAVQRSALCRSRRELSNAYFLAKFCFDTAENEPSQVCRPASEPPRARQPPSPRRGSASRARSPRAEHRANRLKSLVKSMNINILTIIYNHEIEQENSPTRRFRQYRRQSKICNHAWIVFFVNFSNFWRARFRLYPKNTDSRKTHLTFLRWSNNEV